jgi:hypothetical protein
MQVVFGERKQRLVSRFGSQIGTRDYVLVNTDGSIDLSPAAKQVTEGKVSFDRRVVDSYHLQEMFQSLVGLLIQQEVQTLEIVNIQWRWRVLIVALTKSTHRPSRCREQEKESRQ